MNTKSIKIYRDTADGIAEIFQDVCGHTPSQPMMIEHLRIVSLEYIKEFGEEKFRELLRMTNAK